MTGTPNGDASRRVRRLGRDDLVLAALIAMVALPVLAAGLRMARHGWYPHVRRCGDRQPGATTC